MKKIDELVQVLSNLKGIGKKNATRIAFDLLSKDEDDVNYLIYTIKSSYDTIKPCNVCHNLTDLGTCDICTSSNRNRSIICVVEDTRDIYAFNKASSYNGLFHVLGGKIDPLNGIGIDELNIDSLLKRIDENVNEVILALNPDLEGETTILYLTKLLNNMNVKVSRIASGIPIGGNIEYSDSATLIKSLEGRIIINEGEKE
ncbi:recombination mediator RecR [Streptobacillus felis]|uniref:Recombination protein RecR n=1 Tax=Streptobacillus felis TaxID=1384509 RepID=A0A7Z0TA24_9FUSO|nr:recombination mediator RecR [Streptobacillus felis]NYV27590.1 recombination protein RecR [Streptobacillus felis]